MPENDNAEMLAIQKLQREKELIELETKKIQRETELLQLQNQRAQKRLKYWWLPTVFDREILYILVIIGLLIYM